MISKEITNKNYFIKVIRLGLVYVCMRKKFFFSSQKMYKNVNKIVLMSHGDEFFKVDECSREIFKNKKKEK